MQEQINKAKKTFLCYDNIPFFFMCDKLKKWPKLYFSLC